MASHPVRPSRVRRIRRRLMGVAAALLFGVVVTVVVAYVCAVWSPLTYTTSPLGYDATFQGKPPPRLPIQMPAGWLTPQWPDEGGTITTFYSEWKGPGILVASCSVAETAPRSDPRKWAHDRLLTCCRAGWPWGAFEYVVTNDRTQTTSPLSVAGAFEPPAWLPARVLVYSWTGTAQLPVRPVPLNLAANVAFYGGLALAVCWGPGMVRRARRRRAGQCLACAYSVAGLAPGVPCPECGAAVER